MINLLHGDCLDKMKNLEDQSIDLICSDPPYIYDNHGGGQKSNELRRKLSDCHIDYVSNGFDLAKVFTEFQRLCKIVNVVLFCSNKQISSIMSWWEQRGYSVTLLCWHKTNPIPFANGKHLSDLEFIVYIRDKGAFFNNDVEMKLKSKVFVSPSVNHHKRHHDCEKPLKLMKHLISQHSCSNDVVLDCFMGSGTTGMAAKELNRKFIGIEKNIQFFRVAEKRIQNHQWQLSLF